MHKCVRCGTTYEDNDSSILRGCTGCGSIFFLYIRSQQDAVEVKEIERELAAKDTTLEKELTKKIEEEKKKEEIPEKEIKEKKERRIEFGIETVRIPREGVYEINLDALMKKRPLIILEKEKVYFIHLPSVFEVEE